jgi:hypothetical protein
MKQRSPGGIAKVFHFPKEDQRLRVVRFVCRIVCIGFAVIETWSQRQFINEDGIAYLDMSDAFIKHNIHLLINPIWSPLYPTLIGIVTWITRPSPLWEVQIAHLLNLLIFLGTMASFEFLMRQVIRSARMGIGWINRSLTAPSSVWKWELLGYSFFAWSTIGMIWGPRMVTPDLCVAGFIYLDAGLLLKLRAESTSRSSVILGVALGLGYWAKAILFPMAFVFMLVEMLLIVGWRMAARKAASTFLVFSVLALPLFIGMSLRVGRLSYSEAGSLNYAWHVNLFNPYAAAASGMFPLLKHPMALLHRKPDVFGFKEPLSLTYPPRSDMEYWSAGVSPVVNYRQQLRAVRENITVIFTDSHIMPLSGLIIAGVLAVIFNMRGRVPTVYNSWPLLLPAIVATCLYLMVSVEPRYVAPFFVLILLGLLPGMLVEDSKASTSLVTRTSVIIAGLLMILSSLLVVYHLAGFPRWVNNGEMLRHVGESLNMVGVKPGEGVAVIGDSSDGCRWARMGRVHIVAQIIREGTQEFWTRSSPSVQAEVFSAFVQAGAKAVVAEEIPPADQMQYWQRLGDTNYFVRMLSSANSQ